MSISPSFCGICDIRHISKPSEVWCPQCEEGLCTECIEHHSLAKPCRNHTTIPIHVLYYFFHDSHILTITIIFHDANSATRTLMFFTE
jgi:hypothetical protein